MSTQSTQSTTFSSQGQSESENLQREVLLAFAREFARKQKDEIKQMNRKIEKVVKERDACVSSTEKKSNQAYEDIVKRAKDYFQKDQGLAVQCSADALKRIEMMSATYLTALEQESEAVDPDDAEEVAEQVVKDSTLASRQLKRWSKHLISDNKEEMKRKRAKIESSSNAERVAEAAMALMSVYTTDEL